MTDVVDSDAIGKVLLLGGPSGAGKSTVAKELSRRLDIGWIQVDDLRLAFQWSGARLPEDAATAALSFFEQTSGIWTLPPDRLLAGLLSVGEALADAIAIVVANHVVQGDSAIIEGDAILPALLDHPLLRPHVDTGRLSMAFILPGSRTEILQAMTDRGRDPAEKLEPASQMNWLFTTWLRAHASARRLTVLESLPRSDVSRQLEHVWRDLAQGSQRSG